MSGDYPFTKIYDMYYSIFTSRIILQNLQIRALNLQANIFCITSIETEYKIVQFK